MKKFWLVLQREYFIRVRKKSFLIITLLAPFLMAAFLVLPAYFGIKAEEAKHYKVGLINKVPDLQIQNTDQLSFVSLTQFQTGNLSEDDFLNLVKQNDSLFKDLAGIVIIDGIDQPVKLYILSDKAFDLGSMVKSAVRSAFQNYRLMQMNITPEQLALIFQEPEVKSFKLTEKGISQSDTGARTALAFIGAFLAYMFVFMYGGLALRSVMEEKVNRVVELIVSSVRPFELMFGKLVAIMLIALTQFFIWLALLFVLLKGSMFLMQSQNQELFLQFDQALQIVNSLNLGLWVVVFLLFFFAGYLLYGALFAAIGAIVDVETDAQQFVWPLSLPLLVSILAIQPMMQQPDGKLATVLSLFPFTSPIVMPFRIGFGIPQIVPVWQLILSIILLLATVLLAVWIAGKVFRIGILFYGKKVTYRDLWKWIKT